MKTFISLILVAIVASLFVCKSIGSSAMSLLLIIVGMYLFMLYSQLKAMLDAPEEFQSLPVMGSVFMSIGVACSPLFLRFSENLAAVLLFIWALSTGLMIAEPMRLTQWGASSSFMKRFGVAFFLIGGGTVTICVFAYEPMSLMLVCLSFGLTALASFATATHEYKQLGPSEIRSKELGRYFNVKI